MPSIGFRHQRLLQVRELLLRLKSVDLRQKEGEHFKEQHSLGRLQAQKRGHIQGSVPGGSGDVLLRPHDFLIHTWHTEQLNEDLRRKIAKVQDASQAVRVQRKVVERSSKDKQSLEKLKEYKDERVRVEQERAEQVRLDEIAARQHLQSRTKGGRR